MSYPNPASEPAGDCLISMNETRLILGGISRATIRKLVVDGKLPCVRIGARAMFRRSDLTAFIVGAA